MTNCTLPDDIMFAILLWLPVMTLLRLRSISKSWRSHIDSSAFINQHLLHQVHNDCGNLIANITYLGNEWSLLSGRLIEMCVHLDLKKLLPLDMSGDTWIPLDIAASCNGIICVYTKRGRDRLRVALWNPATRQITCLRETTILSDEQPNLVSFFVGFGYVVKTDDYKVVTISKVMNHDNTVAYGRAEVYSLQTDSWKTIVLKFPDASSVLSDSHYQKAYINGYYCWASCLPERVNQPLTYSILSFDFTEEVFVFIQLPDVVSTSKLISLTTIGDSIACFTKMNFSLIEDTYQNSQLDIWVMKEYGVTQSWTKQFTINLVPPYNRTFPYGFSKNGEFLILPEIGDDGRCRLAFCDPNTQKIVNDLPKYTALSVDVYAESLVSTRKVCI